MFETTRREASAGENNVPNTDRQNYSTPVTSHVIEKPLPTGPQTRTTPNHRMIKERSWAAGSHVKAEMRSGRANISRGS